MCGKNFKFGSSKINLTTITLMMSKFVYEIVQSLRKTSKTNKNNKTLNLTDFTCNNNNININTIKGKSGILI